MIPIGNIDVLLMTTKSENINYQIVNLKYSVTYLDEKISSFANAHLFWWFCHACFELENKK